MLLWEKLYCSMTSIIVLTFATIIICVLKYALRFKNKKNMCHMIGECLKARNVCLIRQSQNLCLATLKLSTDPNMYNIYVRWGVGGGGGRGWRFWRWWLHLLQTQVNIVINMHNVSGKHMLPSEGLVFHGYYISCYKHFSHSNYNHTCISSVIFLYLWPLK